MYEGMGSPILPKIYGDEVSISICIAVYVVMGLPES